MQYKYTDSNWHNSESREANCTRITATECRFTTASLSGGFPKDFNVSLRVRAELGPRVSAWATVPWFQHFRNVTIGPPEDIVVTPGAGSLIVTYSAPFDTGSPTEATFSYIAKYWERGRTHKVIGPVTSNSILLENLKPFKVYCLKVQAQLFWTVTKITKPGNFSKEFCSETAADASTRLQQIILICLGTFALLLVLTGGCFLLVRRYQGLIKYWFHTPPSIPSQIEEYLRDPAQLILEVLDQDSSPKDDVWDSVSIISVAEKEGEDLEPKHWSSRASPEEDIEQGS